MEQWNRQIKTAQFMLLGTVIATVVNAAFLLGNMDMFISYCAALAYYPLWLGKLFDNGYAMGIVNGEFAATGMVMTGVVLAVYLVIWWLARGNRRWLKVGLWLIVADLVFLIGLSLVLFANPLSCFWEAVVHGIVIWEIGQGLRAYKKRGDALAKAAAEAAAAAQAAAEEETVTEETAEETPQEDPVL